MPSAGLTYVDHAKITDIPAFVSTERLRGLSWDYNLFARSCEDALNKPFLEDQEEE